MKSIENSEIHTKSFWDEHHNKIADLPPDLSMQSKTTAKVVRTILILHLIHT